MTVAAAENSLAGGVDAVRDLAPSLLIVDKSFGSQAVMDWISGLRVSDSPTTVMVWSSALSELEAVRFLAGWGQRNCAQDHRTANAIALYLCGRGGRYVDG